MESPDTQSVPDVQLRRSSSASIAAKTLLSDSMSTPYLLTPSKKLKETSPGGKKSNGLSSPFIETTQSYERQEHDVGNPNKVSEDLREEDDVPDFSQGILLKDHVEQHRSENKPSHSSPCGSGECDNSDMSLGDLENHFEVSSALSSLRLDKCIDLSSMKTTKRALELSKYPLIALDPNLPYPLLPTSNQTRRKPLVHFL